MRPRSHDRRADASAGSLVLSILGWLLMATLIGAGTSALLLWAFGWPSLPRSSSFTATEIVELLKIVLAVIAGFGGVVLLSVNHRRQKVAEGDHRLALRQEEREKSKLLNERFAAVAEQLAHERPQVRLAGVYALGSLADDWDEGRQKCVDVLLAYLRLSGPENADPGEREVIDAIYRTFRERLTAESPWSKVDFDFTGMTLVDVDFSELRFRGTVTFDRVRFSGARTSFARTWFLGPVYCRETQFGARATSFHRTWFDNDIEFAEARFTTQLDLSDSWVDGGTIEFVSCEFAGDVRATEFSADPGVIRFTDCRFIDSRIDFQYSNFGAIFHSWSVLDVLLGRPLNPSRGKLFFVHCVLDGPALTLDDVVLTNGRVVVRNIMIVDGDLRISPAEMRHPSLDVRQIHTHNAHVDVPLPERHWKGRVIDADDTPPSIRT